MATLREIRLRIRSVKSISQVTRALQAVSTSRVRRAVQAVSTTRPYAVHAWRVLCHIAGQPGKAYLHPMLVERPEVNHVLIVLISGDRGLAGAYNNNVVRYALQLARSYSGRTPEVSVHFVTIGRKGRDLLMRGRLNIIAEFSRLPAVPSFNDVSAIGKLIVDEYLSAKADEVHLVYTDYINMVVQRPTSKRLLPLPVESVLSGESRDETVGKYETVSHGPSPAYIYEPDEASILNVVIPNFTALQIYQAILEALASEHAARMVAMKNATENAVDLIHALQLEYNKARQQSITGEMLDIAGGAEALAQASAGRT